MVAGVFSDHALSNVYRFFISSRRLHTRFLNVTGVQTCALLIDPKSTRLNSSHKQKTAYEISECDWSSDVCSSDRSEEHTSELQSHSEISSAVFCLKKKQKKKRKKNLSYYQVKKKKRNKSD